VHGWVLDGCRKRLPTCNSKRSLIALYSSPSRDISILYFSCKAVKKLLRYSWSFNRQLRSCRLYNHRARVSLYRYESNPALSCLQRLIRVYDGDVLKIGSQLLRFEIDDGIIANDVGASSGHAEASEYQEVRPF